MSKTMTKLDGVGLIAAERERQLEKEEFDAVHDMQHVNGELATAAALKARDG